MNAVMREIRAPITVRTWTPCASYRPSPTRGGDRAPEAAAGTGDDGGLEEI
ncbi:hypothetical protein [Nonomuraea sp. NPDC049480]|uniref:hypothetical protein n=1 Tax=Nonomuraea sp. NPDC049480 TaxID=3364353 RepID=UPI003799872A